MWQIGAGKMAHLHTCINTLLEISAAAKLTSVATTNPIAQLRKCFFFFFNFFLPMECEEVKAKARARRRVDGGATASMQRSQNEMAAP